jgi:hypothetical protein
MVRRSVRRRLSALRPQLPMCVPSSSMVPRRHHTVRLLPAAQRRDHRRRNRPRGARHKIRPAGLPPATPSRPADPAHHLVGRHHVHQPTRGPTRTRAKHPTSRSHVGVRHVRPPLAAGRRDLPHIRPRATSAAGQGRAAAAIDPSHFTHSHPGLPGPKDHQRHRRRTSPRAREANPPPAPPTRPPYAGRTNAK